MSQLHRLGTRGSSMVCLDSARGVVGGTQWEDLIGSNWSDRNSSIRQDSCRGHRCLDHQVPQGQRDQ